MHFQIRFLAVRMVFEKLIRDHDEAVENKSATCQQPAFEDDTLHSFSLPQAIRWVAKTLRTSPERMGESLL